MIYSRKPLGNICLDDLIDDSGFALFSTVGQMESILYYTWYTPFFLIRMSVLIQATWHDTT
jgi:hypothetical protein